MIEQWQQTPPTCADIKKYYATKASFLADIEFMPHPIKTEIGAYLNDGELVELFYGGGMFSSAMWVRREQLSILALLPPPRKFTYPAPKPKQSKDDSVIVISDEALAKTKFSKKQSKRLLNFAKLEAEAEKRRKKSKQKKRKLTKK